MGLGSGLFPVLSQRAQVHTTVGAGGFAPADLHWWLFKHNAWLIACIPTTEAGLKAVPTTVFFVSTHNG